MPASSASLVAWRHEREVDHVAVLVQHRDGAVLLAAAVERADVEGDHEVRAAGPTRERVTPSGSPRWIRYSTSPSTSAIRRCASGRAAAIAGDDPGAVRRRHARREARGGVALGGRDPRRVGREPVADRAVAAGAEQQRGAGERGRGERGGRAQGASSPWTAYIGARAAAP